MTSLDVTAIVVRDSDSASGRLRALCRQPSCGHRGCRGFSLLEAVVAFALTAMALMVLYQTTAGSLQRIGQAEAYAHALLLAQALLTQHPEVPPEGLQLRGESSDGYRWEVMTAPLPELTRQVAAPVMLHQIGVVVAWRSGLRDYQVELQSARLEAW